MKKGFAFMLVAMVVFCTGAVSAQELGNPAKLIKKGQIDIGLQGTLIIEQSFADHQLNTTYSNGAQDSERKGSDFEDDALYMATITYGLLDQINLFARLGMADGGTWIDKQAGNDWKGNLESNFVWAVGAKGRALELDNGFGVELGAQYLRYDNREVSGWRNQETGQTASQLGWNTDDAFDYWQVDAVATAYWTIGVFTPYVGGGFSWSEVRFNGRWTHENPGIGWVDYDSNFSNEDNFSALVGLDLDLGDHFKANLQGTFVSRTALSLGISYCF